jgi:DNA-binding HxlR family transcriptional regulator
MAERRTYGDLCGIARALDFVGERWALLVVRELLLGPKRFTDLRTGLPHLSPNVLAQRLRELEESGIVKREKLPPPAASQVYELTPWGHELEEVVLSLGRWGSRTPIRPDTEMSVDSYVLALKTLFDPGADGGGNATYGLRIGEDRFAATVADGRFEIVRGDAVGPDANLATDRQTLAELLWQGRSVADAVSSGDLEIEGEERAAARFLELFTQPEPVPVRAQ